LTKVQNIIDKLKKILPPHKQVTHLYVPTINVTIRLNFEAPPPLLSEVFCYPRVSSSLIIF